MVFFNNRRDDASDFSYVDAVPKNNKTAKQKRMWRLIAIGVATVIVIVVVVVVAVTVTNHNKKASSTNGSATISPFANLTLIKTNNDTALQQKERFFVLGDVHGCVDELNALVTKLNYNATTDQLILAGDITSKGPDSVGVIRRAKELGALCVRGNHDDEVIRFKTFANQRGQNAMLPLSATMPEGNVPDPLKFKDYHTAIALNMTQDDYDYLTSCPVILHLPFLNNTVVVHGGLDPNIPLLQDQVPYMVMTMRDIDKSNQTISDNNVGIQWSQGWNDYQKMLTVNNTMIYYGHDASRGLNLRDYSFGVDTGCVYGKQLTAINIKTHELTQVSCKMYVNKDDE